jgi:hypothetical protein
VGAFVAARLDSRPGPLHRPAPSWRRSSAIGILARFGAEAEVLYFGLFSSHVGEARNQPITRFGRIALVPDEPVFWEDSNVRVILAEIASFPGPSGSPVFIFAGHTDDRRRPAPRLLGVLKGSFT